MSSFLRSEILLASDRAGYFFGSRSSSRVTRVMSRWESAAS
ncbi:Uncharacterised protein [Mycobacteroides abscessus]|nr:Uncharacterised protein [Mycobacteroides abscessus]